MKRNVFQKKTLALFSHLPRSANVLFFIHINKHHSYTSVEMLIVLFIIAILLILIIPNITKNIDTAKDKSSEAYEKTVQSQVTAYEINEKDKDVTFEKLVEKHYLDGPADKASTAPNGKKIVIANGKATLQK